MSGASKSVLLWVGVILPYSAAGQIIYVDANAAGPVHDGSSWCEGFLHLQDALAAASGGGVTEIRVADGVYKPDQGAAQTPGDRESSFQLLNGVTLAGGYAGCGAPDPDDRNISNYETVLSGDLLGNDVDVPVDQLAGHPSRAENSLHVMVGSGTDSSAALNGFTVQGGDAYGVFPLSCGGGMLNESGSPSIANCTFTRNSTQVGNGGGVCNYNGSEATIQNCRFVKNAAGTSGGGLYNSEESHVTMTNCVVADNAADYGAGMYNFSSDVVASNCVFVGNDALDGGGVHNNASDSVYVNCTIGGNEGRDGGGVYNRNCSPVFVNSLIWRNFPPSIFNENSYPVISYSNIEGGYPGQGNLNVAPLFVDKEGGDYSLLSWSPCVDAGDNTAVDPSIANDASGQPRFSDHACAPDVGNPGPAPAPIVDIGAYEFQSLQNCGNDLCDAGETCETCACDCGDCCGNGVCDAAFEDCLSCPADCGCQSIHVPTDYATIQGAIDAANNGDEISVAPGTYNEAINFLGKAITLKSDDGPEVTFLDPVGTDLPAATCDSGEDANTILSGFTLIGRDRNGGLSVGFSGPTVINCVFDGSYEHPFSSGAGISNGFSYTTVNNCAFYRNRNSFGGGISSYESDISVTGCTFTENSSDEGGGIRNSGGSAIISNCLFVGNESDILPPPARAATPGEGGAIVNFKSDVLVTGCTFTSNVSDVGGAISNYAGNVVITDCDFSQNSADEGGAIYNRYGNPFIRNSTFDQNSSAFHGGAIDNHASAVISNCIFTGNASERGGAIENSSSGTQSINCVFRNNSATVYGGAIYNGGTDASVSNCILWGNLPDEIVYGTVSYSCIRGGLSATSVDGGGNIEAYPRFLDADSGDFRLLSGSPCIDAGNSTSVDSEVTTDLDGNPRIVDHACVEDTGNPPGGPVVDMGAYELQEPANCGNGVCDGGETCQTCACDCGDCCGDGTCADANEACLTCPDDCPCQTIYVPADSMSIQDAINVANDGDEVVVAPGIYFESINFLGKSVTLRSSDGPDVTTIDASGLDSPVVTCNSGEISSAQLQGFKLTGGNAYLGGGMYNDYSSPTVDRCIFIANSASYGGGMYNRGGNTTATNCIFLGNSATVVGGAMRNTLCNPRIINCAFHANSADGNGGAIAHYTASPTITNCSFAGNSAEEGAALYNYWDSSPIVINSVLHGNTPDQVSNYDAARDKPTIGYSCVKGGLPEGSIDAGGNIDTDPQFIDPFGPDGLPGTLDDNLSLSESSPAVDAGDNMAPGLEGVQFDANGHERFYDMVKAPDVGNPGTPPRPIVDMGAFEANNDCNKNGMDDDEDLASGLAPDCNLNGLPDICDVNSGNSIDFDNDGIPDECAVRTRYIAFRPVDQVTVVAKAIALPDGRVGWLDAPQEMDWFGMDPEPVSIVVEQPVFRAWVEDRVYVTGCVIVPAQFYAISSSTDGTDFFDPIVVQTVTNPSAGSWGDIVGQFNNGSWTAPNGFVNFNDIDAAVKKFQTVPSAPHTTIVDLHPQWPNYFINFADIDMVIKGFQEIPYPVAVSDCQTIANCPLGGEGPCLP